MDAGGIATSPLHSCRIFLSGLICSNNIVANILRQGVSRPVRSQVVQTFWVQDLQVDITACRHKLIPMRGQADTPRCTYFICRICGDLKNIVVYKRKCVYKTHPSIHICVRCYMHVYTQAKARNTEPMSSMSLTLHSEPQISLGNKSFRCPGRDNSRLPRMYCMHSGMPASSQRSPQEIDLKPGRQACGWLG